MPPVNRCTGSASPFRGKIRRYDAVADRKNDKPEYVINYSAGHNGRTFFRIEFLSLGKNSSRNTYRCRRGHNSHVKSRRISHRLSERKFREILEIIKEFRKEIHDAEIAEQKRTYDAADADERSDERIPEEHLEIRLKAGKEKKNNRCERRYSVKRGARRVKRPVTGDSPEHFLYPATDGIHLSQRRAVK